MQFRLLFSILFFAMISQSCSSGGNQKKETTQQKTDSVPAKENFQTGQIIEKVINKNDASQNYALYLPKAYSIKTTWPVIFIFDAHGDGKLPITKYNELAEQYGFILVGSNNSQNGNAWEVSQDIATKLFADAEGRLAINNQQIYVMGFSGGARVANGLALTNGSVAGAICCGASAPATSPSNNQRGNYSFIGLVGNEDFNYTEMKKYDMVDLAGHNVKHALITFDGKHEWPAKDIMDKAFWWLTLNEMRKNIPAKNSTLIAQHLEPIYKQLEILKQKKQTVDLYYLCTETINFYNGLDDLKNFYDTYKELQNNPEIDKDLKEQETAWKKEEELKAFYMKAIQTQNFEWWKKDIGSLNQKIKNNKNKNEALMYKRTLSYLSLVAYMQTSGALKQNAIDAADFFSKIYVLVDPTNNEAHYLTASVYAKTNKTKDAINSLNDAIKNGFADAIRLQNDSTFMQLKSNDDFLKILNKIKK
jgi:hypothetical protein